MANMVWNLADYLPTQGTLFIWLLAVFVSFPGAHFTQLHIVRLNLILGCFPKFVCYGLTIGISVVALPFVIPGSDVLCHGSIV